MATISFPKEIENHKDEWVALTGDNRLAGHGKLPADALASAAANGEPDVTLFFAAKEFWMADRALIGGRFIPVEGG
jgi:hypothetical protein